MKAQFKFLSGARAGQMETFRKHYIGLGRHPLSDVRFDAERDLDVSSRHAAIVQRGEGSPGGGGFVLQDLGSKNGTFVNGKRVTGDVTLADGDVLGFGANGPAVEFRIVAAEEGEATTAGAEAAARRASSPREPVPALTSPPPP
ncbi:MAG: FHA domain-containing protein, partial [Gemmatimonadales bacterium]